MSTTQTKLGRERRRSREIFERAEKVLVGGVNSPVRAFRSVGGEPLIIERGRGQHLYDADGNELLDYVCSWGAMLLGHAHPAVSAAIAEQAQRGTSFGVTTELELERATLSNAVMIEANAKPLLIAGGHRCLTDLTAARLNNACLLRADLSMALLVGADLANAEVRRADLRGASLHGAVLSGVDLRAAMLDGADLAGAVGIEVSLLSLTECNGLQIGRSPFGSPDE